MALLITMAVLPGCSGRAAATPTPDPPPTAVPTPLPVAGTGPIVAIGDSLTYGYGNGVTLNAYGPPPEGSYPADMERDLGVPVINAGISGTSAHEVLDPASEPNHPRPIYLQLQSLIAQHPRLMVVMFTTEALRGYPISRTIGDLTQLVVRIDAAHIPILLAATHVDCTVHVECLPPKQVYTAAWDQALITLAAQYNAGLVLDVERGFTPGLLTDWIHCNALGYQIMANRIEVGVRARLGTVTL
ncbi:MAG TPA: GDSL-type esterase/lipase family protein [Candidatus Dormibacteraeota bacterium]|nr:GDSL-type esterase/lipase family protein [Candidatus Dormibacteraeota bacterium]